MILGSACSWWRSFVFLVGSALLLSCSTGHFPDGVGSGQVESRLATPDGGSKTWSDGVSLDDIRPFQAASGAFTKVPYTSPLYDDSGQWDSANSRFIPREPGDYQVCASLAVNGGPTFELDVFLNGTRKSAIVGGTNTSWDLLRSTGWKEMVISACHCACRADSQAVWGAPLVCST